MINAAVISREPSSIVVSFNRSVSLSEFAHVSIKVGEIPLVNPAWSTSVGEVTNDKPASMWACPLDNLTEDDTVQVKLSCDPQQVTFALQPGHYILY